MHAIFPASRTWLMFRGTFASHDPRWNFFFPLPNVCLEPTNDWLVWHKNNDGLSFSECELAWTNFGCQVRHLTHHWGGEEKRHPTQKPLDVMRWCFKWADDPKTVVDPFMGSGTTLVAAKLDGRHCIGMDTEEEYCEIAAKRLSQTTASMF